ncbi:7598_t:CDS:10 [Entrophospora sp. SA101]|nr:7598_t:CDS:10 [Entrophospora sp. SA101]
MRSRRNTFSYGDPQTQIYSTANSIISNNINSRYELVPYSKEWTIILRNEHSGQLVLYNTSNHRVSLQQLPHTSEHVTSTQILTTPHACIMCRRPFDSPDGSSARNLRPNFIHRNYFRASLSSSTAEEEERTTNADGETLFEILEDTLTLSENSFNQGYYERFFIEEKKLGRGFRGSVFLCKHVLDNVPLGEYAIKKVAVGDNHAWLVRMLREVHLLETLHHPNIVDYKHAWLEYHKLTDFGPQVPCLFILMECANAGNLEEYLNEFDEKLTPKERLLRERRMKRAADGSGRHNFNNRETRSSIRYLELHEIWSLFMDICKGLAHLHRHGIVHRDLKPSNLLLHYNNPNDRAGIPSVLISDFGECEVLDQLTERDRTGATGTLEFMAPELVTVDDKGKYLKDYSPKSDIWSLGMVLYYLCYSRLPYHHVDDVDLLKQEILDFNLASFPENKNTFIHERKIPSQIRNLIKRLLSRNSKDRPLCDEILKSIEDIQNSFNVRDAKSVFVDKFGASTISSSDIPAAASNSTSSESIIIDNNVLGTSSIEASKIPSDTGNLSSLIEKEEIIVEEFANKNLLKNEIISSNLRLRHPNVNERIGNVEENVELPESSSLFDTIDNNDKKAVLWILPPSTPTYKFTYLINVLYSQISKKILWRLKKAYVDNRDLMGINPNKSNMKPGGLDILLGIKIELEEDAKVTYFTGNLCALHAKRVTLTKKDMELANRLRDRNGIPFKRYYHH